MTFECPNCERKFLMQEGLQEHMKKEHDYLETSNSLLSEASSGWMNSKNMSNDNTSRTSSVDVDEELLLES